ncbi:MAG: excalibur calcium-binding domain-containing protein [Hydrogenophilaceae bacterium]
MKKLVFLIVIAIGAWHWYSNQSQQEASASNVGNGGDMVSQPERPVDQKFSCDGRTHCSQMTSCEESTYFLQHCPGTVMDGDSDGIPCEQQWCN